MLKTALMTACVLAASVSIASAQSRLPIAGPNDAPFGANGQADRSVGGDPNVNHTFNGSTSSSSMRNAQLKWESAHGASSASGVSQPRQ
jgi:hypothetical protein